MFFVWPDRQHTPAENGPLSKPQTQHTHLGEIILIDGVQAAHIGITLLLYNAVMKLESVLRNRVLFFPLGTGASVPEHPFQQRITHPHRAVNKIRRREYL